MSSKHTANSTGSCPAPRAVTSTRHGSLEQSPSWEQGASWSSQAQLISAHSQEAAIVRSSCGAHACEITPPTQSMGDTISAQSAVSEIAYVRITSGYRIGRPARVNKFTRNARAMSEIEALPQENEAAARLSHTV